RVLVRQRSRGAHRAMHGRAPATTTPPAQRDIPRSPACSTFSLHRRSLSGTSGCDAPADVKGKQPMELMDAPYERGRDVLEEVDGVVVVEWPEHAARAADLTRTRTPHLFLVAPGAQPPDTSDDLSGWIRLPAAERNIQAKIVELRSRASIARP